mgnify:CR=1 FL=1
MRIDWISLVKTETPDGVFRQAAEVSRVSCWAKLQSATYGEFYKADANGRKADAVFDVSSIDYQRQQKLIHHSANGDIEYDILRAYSPKSGTVLLTCSLIGG